MLLEFAAILPKCSICYCNLGTKKIATLQSKGVDVVHLSSCLRAKDENYEAFAQQLAENFAVVGYTHGGESGKTRDSIILNKVSK